MLQWMGGSRRKVTASRKSTQKRQKQYFEQRKRQQQNLQMMGSENCYDNPGISGQSPKERRSLDILNLLNLSEDAQKYNSFCPKVKEMDDGEISVSTMPGFVPTNQPRTFPNMEATVNPCGSEETKAGAPLCCQIETSPKKVSASDPDRQNIAFNGPPSHWKTVTDQYTELSVIDLLCDDEPNPTVEKSPTCEDHVSFSLEGLGKVGTETPVHSPEQQARFPYRNSPLLKDGRKSKLKNLNNVLDDIELEVDTMAQDIRVSPISASNFPYNKLKQNSAIVGDCKPFYDHTGRNGSSISEEHFYDNNEDIWNGSIFADEKFDKEMRYNRSSKKIFQMGSKSPELLNRGAAKIESYDFEDLLPTKWSSATAMNEINTSEPLASFSKDHLENDFDFYVASRERLDENFNAQHLIPEDVRDNSSLLSEESCSSTAVRGESVRRPPSRRVTEEENRKKYRNAFASPKHKCSTKEDKCRSTSNPSKRKSSHFSNSLLQEELGAYKSWQFEERCAAVDRSSVTTSFCQDLEANFSVFGTNNRTEDPFSIFSNPELHNMAGPSFGGFKNAAPLADSPPCSFTSEKFAFDCSTAIPKVHSWATGLSSESPDFQFKEGPEDTGVFLFETSSTDISVQGSVCKGEKKVKSHKDRRKSFEQKDIFMGDNELSSEKKIAGDAPTSNNHTLECEGTEDTNPKTVRCLETADSPGYVEEISSSLKKPDNHESQLDNKKKLENFTRSNCDAEIPLKCKITNEETRKSWQAKGRNSVNEKHSSDQISLSGQVKFESYIFQLLRVQKVVKGTPTTNSAFLGHGISKIYHQT